MPFHQETRDVPFTAQQLYNLVADIEEYPSFIPWCEALRIREDNVVDGKGELVADMVVRYKLFLEKFQSKVQLDPDQLKISAHYLQGPFESLENHWSFSDHADGGCVIEFSIQFQFKSRILQAVAMEMFDRVFKKMSDAFIRRAHTVYGKSIP